MTSQWRDVNLDDVLPAWGSRSAQSMEDSLRELAPRSKGLLGGRFAGTIEAHETDNGREVDGEGAAVPGRFLVEGTQAHIIEGNPVLHWEDAEGDHFARRVHHPGTEPSDFVERCIDSNQEKWEGDLLDAIAAQWGDGTS